MNIGQRVMLIANYGMDDYPEPPIGAIGEIDEPLDFDGEYGVMFPDHPCPAGPTPNWFFPQSYLIRVDDPAVQLTDIAAHQLVNT